MLRGMERVVGVDVAAGRWVAVVFGNGRFEHAEVCAALDVLLAGLGRMDAVVVDIPIGLPPAGTVRACDGLARAALGPRRSSLFSVPSLAVLTAASHAQASARHVAETGKGISQQSYALRHRILEAAGVDGLREGHPELSFALMGAGPCAASKKSWDGQRDRLTRLAAHAIVLPDALGPAGRVAPDDLLDAAAMAWTARRVARGEAVVFGPGPSIVA